MFCSSWFHVNSNLLQPVSYGPRLHSVAHMLLVEDARPEDGGQYRCTARNEMGELSVTLHLQVEPPLVVGEFYSGSDRLSFIYFNDVDSRKRQMFSSMSLSVCLCLSANHVSKAGISNISKQLLFVLSCSPIIF